MQVCDEMQTPICCMKVRHVPRPSTNHCGLQIWSTWMYHPLSMPECSIVEVSTFEVMVQFEFGHKTWWKISSLASAAQERLVTTSVENNGLSLLHSRIYCESRVTLVLLHTSYVFSMLPFFSCFLSVDACSSHWEAPGCDCCTSLSVQREGLRY